VEAESGFSLVIACMRVDSKLFHLSFRFKGLLLVSIAMLFFLTSPQAQSKQKNALTLKSGEVLYGRILSNDSINGIYLENECGIRIIQQSDLDTIQSYVKRNFFSQKRKGYYNLSSLALLFGEGRNDNIPVPSLTIVNGYYFHPQVFTGIGIGYEYYEWSVLPLFTEVKYLLKKDGLIPFASLKLGYGISLKKEDQVNDYYSNDIGKTYGGALISPEVGLLIPVGDKDAFLIAIGYHHQELSYNSYEYYYWLSSTDYMKKRVYTNYNRISFRVSFMFR
jgi:hypothetical protein